jgi:hypothetical protein
MNSNYTLTVCQTERAALHEVDKAEITKLERLVGAYVPEMGHDLFKILVDRTTGDVFISEHWSIPFGTPLFFDGYSVKGITHKDQLAALAGDNMYWLVKRFDTTHDMVTSIDGRNWVKLQEIKSRVAIYEEQVNPAALYTGACSATQEWINSFAGLYNDLIAGHKGPSYRRTSEILRSEAWSSASQEYWAVFDQWASKCPGALYRSFFNMETLEVGEMYYDKGILSTSTDRDYAKAFNTKENKGGKAKGGKPIFLTIRGANGIPLEILCGTELWSKTESEVVLAPGSGFKVLRDLGFDGEHHCYEVEWIDPYETYGAWKFELPGV